VTSMDEVTQQNAALVEEAAAAAESLLDQSQQLDSMMAKFRVTDEKSAGWSGEVDRRRRDAWKAVELPVRPAAPERRSASRPWSKPAGASAAGNKSPAKPAAAARPALPPARPAPRASGGGSGDDWTEF